MPYSAPEKRDLYNRALGYLQANRGNLTDADVIQHLEHINPPTDSAETNFLSTVTSQARDSYDLAQRMNASGGYRPRRTTYPGLSYQDNRRPEFEYRVVVRSTAIGQPAAVRALVIVRSDRGLTADEAIAEAYRLVGANAVEQQYLQHTGQLSNQSTTSADLVAVFRRSQI